MKKKLLALLLASALAALPLVGCGSSSADTADTSAEAAEEETEEETGAEEAGSEETTEDSDGTAANTEAAEETDETADEETGEETADETDEAADTEAAEETDEDADAEDDTETTELEYDGTTIRVGSLSGPTTMGIVNLWDASDNGESVGTYEFQIGSEASEIGALLTTEDIDIALIPANLAANLYNKTDGGVTVIDINTLGVLYCVTGDGTITSIEDLAGRTVMSTGQGATPEYVLSYLLDAYSVEDVTVEFYSESTEIAAYLQEDPTGIAILPQPFVTSATAQNDALAVVFSLTEAWDAVVEDGSMLVTGATVVRTEFLEEHPDAVAVFLEEHAASAAAASEDVEGTAELVVEYGVLSSAAIAAKALPECNIVCITGDEMVDALTGYLGVLYEQDASSIGGAMPEDDFYYTAE